jgi:RNA recognition motif-containing protein
VAWDIKDDLVVFDNLGTDRFLCNFPLNWTEDALKRFTGEFGHVIACQIILWPATGLSRGFAFVRFSSPSVARRVTKLLNGHIVGTRRIACKPITPRNPNVEKKED